MDQIDRLYELAGADGRKITLKAVANKSGVTEGTLYNWRRRKTKRPQFASVKAVVRGLGANLSIGYQGRFINGRARQ